ncbi:hypothetical protein WMQ26_15045 [Vibrio diabolicus]|uniref:hypothetical protein n=1 Tax=Vibrio diabolicus TaxID=50719 RepID=UPI0037516C2E
MTKNIKSYDSIFIEPKCCSGHVELYKELIRTKLSSGTVLFVSTSDYLRNFDDLEVDKHVINTIDASNKLLYRLQQILFLFKVALLLRNISYKECIFLSYENISFFPFSYTNNRILVVEHNNIDQLLSSKFKSLFYRLTSNDVEHIVFEGYIGEYITSKYNKKHSVLEHPKRRIVALEPNEIDRDYIFCPSGDASYDFLIKLSKYCKDNNLLLITKDNYDLSQECDVIQKKFFSNYDSIFKNAKYIAIGVDFSYRVSGVFYEAIANDKRVILNDCIFSSNVKLKYNKNIEIVL